MNKKIPSSKILLVFGVEEGDIIPFTIYGTRSCLPKKSPELEIHLLKTKPGKKVFCISLNGKHKWT